MPILSTSLEKDQSMFNEQDKNQSNLIHSYLSNFLFFGFTPSLFSGTDAKNGVLQLMCLADLEYDYINPYDSASRINKAVLPEFVAQGVLCVLHLITGHWVMFLICVPYTYYNVTT